MSTATVTVVWEQVGLMASVASLGWVLSWLSAREAGSNCFRSRLS